MSPRLWLVMLVLGAAFAWQHRGAAALAWERAQPGYRPPPVTLLATAWCGYCAKMRKYLAAEGIAYVELDVETSAEGQARYEALESPGVPVILVGSEIIYGYDPDGVSAALASR